MKKLKISDIVQATSAGNIAFSAEKVRAQLLGGLMDPIIGFDHFKLTKDVFGAHPHAGMSAISYLFEDSVPYHNLDSIGTDIVIAPGDLLWTWAGKGVVHTEFPVPEGGEVHGLQLFVNIKASKKQLPPSSTHISNAVIPEIKSDGLRVRVVSGTCGNVSNPVHAPEEFTFLHIFLSAGKSFEHDLRADWNATIYVVNGGLELKAGSETAHLEKSSVISLGQSDQQERLAFTAVADSQFIVLSGQPLNEEIFAHGSLTMSSTEELSKALNDFNEGRMGFIRIENGERSVILPVT